MRAGRTCVQEGPEYQSYNDLPMFRYNAYFGINTVHYLDLVDAQGPNGLPLIKIILSALMTKIAKNLSRTGNSDRILTPLAKIFSMPSMRLSLSPILKKTDSRKLFRCFSARRRTSRRLAFSTMAYGRELRRIPAGQKVAIFGLTMKMEDVLIRGTFNGVFQKIGDSDRHCGYRLGV